MTSHKTVTHEAFVQRVYTLARSLPTLTKADRKALDGIKLTYGTGQDGLRGVTHYAKWACGCDAHGKRLTGRKDVAKALVGICATGQESVVQLCGTTLHELAHVIAGLGAGHGPAWRQACARIGLPAAVNGTEYRWDCFEPTVASKLQRLPVPNDGKPLTLAAQIAALKASGQGAALPPAYQGTTLPPEPRVRICLAGFGTRGGQSRGAGAGSRYLLWTAQHKAPCTRPSKLRCASTELAVTCVCGAAYTLDDASLPPAHGMGQSGQGVPAATARKHGARTPLAARKRAKATIAAPAT